MFDFESRANRFGTGNMKGQMESMLPTGAILLSGAEMDQPTAPCIRQALAAFAENGLYGFTVPDDDYLDTICRWLHSQRGAEVESAWIVPTMGTVSALSTAVRALTNEGDGVIVQSPSYYRFDRAVLRNGRRIVLNPLLLESGRYRLDFADLERKMGDPSNKLMILVDPHNPTGKVFPEEDLIRIRELAEKFDVTVFSDEIFAETAQPGFETRPYAVIDPVHGMSCVSMGKSFNFTGVSQANLLIPDADLRRRFTAQRDREHYGSVDPFFYAALRAAYSEEGAAWLRAMNAHTAENHRLIAEAVAGSMPLISVLPLEGTFVAWLDCRGLGLTDEELQAFFETRAEIYADPGIEYGESGSGFYRWNVAVPTDTIQKALRQLKKAYDALTEREERRCIS